MKRISCFARIPREVIPLRSVLGRTACIKRHRLNFYPIRNVEPTEIIMSKYMKRTILALLLTPLLCSCETARDVGVTTFRVIDAPAAYVRRHIDEDGQVTET